ncbi:MAG: tRNA ((37)-N6)-threonylcarbamoyltransferase complex dimerization subunit type 1 TsaB [Frankiales bacterium]|jgi:tRNA threonylcarbamoyl adenosine modification protein YeaZ|nr:tRNA ((37)-N6)-threonylcarbamoyltransferase complex dimerization subunit type 1 TsaB [Frankiales bacterium]
MLVLGLDTSTPAVSVALVERGGRTLAERVVVDAKRHGELLAQGIRDVLADAGADRRDLSAVAVGLGPGPFTGLRVGIVTAATTADALGIPAYGICSLDALGDGERIAVTDARRREVYWARYDSTGARVDGPAVGPPAQLALQWQGIPLVGDGARLPVFADLAVRDEPRYPSAARIAQLAEELAPLVPLYLRRPDAEVPAAPKKVTA